MTEARCLSLSFPHSLVPQLSDQSSTERKRYSAGNTLKPVKMAEASSKQSADSVLRQRKPLANGITEQFTEIGTDDKDKEEVTWGKTASGQGKYLDRRARP